MPKMIDLHRRLKDQGLVLIGIHTKNRGEKMAEYAKEVEIPFPLAVDVDGKTVAAFAVDSYPDYYLIDRAGNLRVADLANGDLERAIGVLLAEPDPTSEKEKGEEKDDEPPPAKESEQGEPKEKEPSGSGGGPG